MKYALNACIAAKAKRSASVTRSSVNETKRFAQPILRLFAFCALLLCLIANPGLASAQGKPIAATHGNARVKVTGIYSNMTYGVEEGDVLGTEIFVVNTNRGYYVVFQSGEGEPTVPVIVPAEVSGLSIRFVLPSEIVGGTFIGTIGSAQLSGSFSSNHQVIHLKRKASYWQ